MFPFLSEQDFDQDDYQRLAAWNNNNNNNNNINNNESSATNSNQISKLIVPIDPNLNNNRVNLNYVRNFDEVF
jgi:hypothetical protein